MRSVQYSAYDGSTRFLRRGAVRFFRNFRRAGDETGVRRNTRPCGVRYFSRVRDPACYGGCGFYKDRSGGCKLGVRVNSDSSARDHVSHLDFRGNMPLVGGDGGCGIHRVRGTGGAFASCSAAFFGAVRIVAVLIAVLLLLTSAVSAKEYTFSLDELGGDEISGEWSGMLDSLPEGIRNELEGYDPSDIGSATEIVREKSSAGFWLSKLWSAVCSALPDVMTGIVPMLCTVIFMSVSKGAVGTIASPAMAETYVLIVKTVGVISVFTLTSSALSLASAYLSRICGIMNTLTPVMEGVYIASGSLTEMTVASQALMIFVTVIGNVNAYVLTPLVSAMATLAAVSAVCSEAKLGGFIAGAGRLLLRVWQIISIFFSFMLTSQTLIARSADTLGGRAVKFAIGSFIPVAGGMLAEAYQTVHGGLSFIKSATGIGGIIVILLILVSGIVPILLYRFAVTLGEVSSEMLGLSEISSLMGEIGALMNFLLAIVLYTSLIFVLALIIFAKSGVA